MYYSYHNLPPLALIFSLLYFMEIVLCSILFSYRDVIQKKRYIQLKKKKIYLSKEDTLKYEHRISQVLYVDSGLICGMSLILYLIYEFFCEWLRAI